MTRDQILPQAPWVGVGCAAFGGTCSAPQAHRILDAAFQGGVRWFDTARSYGFGESETILGRWLHGIDRRGVIVATKVGKRPESVSRFHRFLRQQGGRAIRRMTGRRRQAPPVLEEQIRRTVGHVDVAELRDSVSRSLEALGTDYLDVLHLHSVGEDCLTDQLVAALEDLLGQNLVRWIGLATNRRDCEQLLERGLPAQVVQIPDCAAWEHPVRWQSRPGTALVTHSVLGRDGQLRQMIRGVCQRNSELRKVWSDRLGTDVGSDQGVVECLLRGAVARNSAGGVLCGVSRPTQVDVIRRITESPLDVETAAELQQLIVDCVRQGTTGS